MFALLKPMNGNHWPYTMSNWLLDIHQKDKSFYNPKLPYSAVFGEQKFHNTKNFNLILGKN